MRKYLYIGIGGFTGAILRYLIKDGWTFNFFGKLPLDTLIINILGSFLLAFFLAMTSRVRIIGNSMKLGIATGFLGAFTTFSTLCRETVMMGLYGNYVLAAIYIILSMTLGIVSVYIGSGFAHAVFRRFDP